MNTEDNVLNDPCKNANKTGDLKITTLLNDESALEIFLRDGSLK